MAAPDSDLDALLDAAQAAYGAEQWTECQRLAGELLSRSTAGGDPRAEVSAHVLLSHATQRQGDHQRAAAHAASALSLCQAFDDPRLQASSKVAAARVSWSVGDNDQALVDLEAALALTARCEDHQLNFDAQNLMGIVNGDLGNAEVSIAWNQRALALAEQCGLPRMRAIARANLAGRELDRGELLLAEGALAESRAALQRSLALAEEALQISRAAGMQRIQVVVLSNQGAALALLGRAGEAMEAFEQQLLLAELIGDRSSKVHRAHYLARMFREAGELDRARALAAQGLEIGEQAGAKNLLVSLYELASAIAEQQGDHVEALRLYKRFHALRSELALNSAQQRARVLAVRLETERAQAEAAAERSHAQALRLANEELARRAEALGRDALEDALTGLANRRRLDAYLSLCFERARRAGTPLCVALIDLDHFKQINDAFSHAVGDTVLRQLGGLLQAHCRSQDLAARWGGEEFLIALDDVGLAGARAICERLRQAVQAHDWAAIAPGLTVTASLGLCDVARHESLAAGLLQADTLLYQAKQAGRNRVCC